VHEIGFGEFSQAVIKCSDISGWGAESITAVADDFGFVVESLDDTVGDGEVEEVEDVGFVSAQHPGEIAEWFESGMSGPPEPFIEEPFGVFGGYAFPEFPEGLFEEPGAMAAQVEFFEVAKPGSLLVGEVFRILEPDEFGSFEKIGVGLFQPDSLLAADLIDSPEEVLDDVKAVEHQRCLGKILVDHIDIGLPHVAADPDYPLSQPFPVLFEKRTECFLSATRTRP